jgi:hypothetical protein
MTGALAAGGEHAHLDVGFSVGPLWLRVALLAAVLVVAGFALLRGFLAEPDRRTTVAVVTAAGVAAALELLLSGGLALPDQAVPLLLAAIALPLYLALSSDPARAAAVGVARRFAPWVFWPAAALAAIRFTQAWFGGADRAQFAPLLHAGVVLGLVAVAWFAVARPHRGTGVLVMRISAGVLATGLVAGVGQAAVSRNADPAPGRAAGVTVDVGGRQVHVVVVPNLPGLNLVHVDVDGLTVGTDPADQAMPQPAGWHAVELPAGRAEVRVGDGRAFGSFVTDTGSSGAAPTGLAGPDGPECASALLGRMLATGPLTSGATCPADRLRPRDADRLTGTVDRLAGSGATSVVVVTDGSPRGKAAAETVRTAAMARGMAVHAQGRAAEPLVVVSGWARAAVLAQSGVVDRGAGGPAAYFAPWLPAPAPGTTAVPAAGVVDREGASYQRYVTALLDAYPTQRPSVAGYRGWLGGDS